MTTTKKEIQVICITDQDCERNVEFKKLMDSISNGKMIDFYTTDFDELTIIAKHRVLPVPTILVLSNGKVICRIVHPPSNEQILDIFQSLNLNKGI